MTSLHFAIACGGTGGHVLPGVAVGQVLRGRGHEVVLWLSGRPVEDAALGEWDGPVFRTGARPLAPRTLLRLPAATVRCWQRLRLDRPSALLAMGCYTSVPPVLAARWRGVPVVLHEANAVPGKAFEWLGRLACARAYSFEPPAGAGAAGTFRTGLPLRAGLAGRPPLPGFRSSGGFTVLVTGGSQGAHALNLAVAETAECLARRDGTSGWRLIHQTGTADAEAIRARYAAAGIEALVFPFLSDIGAAYAAADWAVCRSGAGTCAELCLCGPPALLVPLPTAARDHQRANAAELARAGAADVLDPKDLTAARLLECLDAARRDTARRDAMRAALRAQARPDAAAQVADLMERFARS
jgi:UDP-N-acetylglucosamine--N-acetylmuramyl-(pentapeptide) pyrophosphoryl-undecaprenol N-acetylglucosamine transferase